METFSAPLDGDAAGTPGPTSYFSVLFADVAGSTKLYDTLGDTQAKLMVDECIAVMRTVVAQCGGRVIKTIGDEVMCVLPTVDSGFLAATDMQFRISALPEVSGVKRAIRVGFHFGAVIEENNDVFGDTVNLAARMAGLAKGSQIITTLSTVKQLAPALRASTRNIAALAVKGKGDDVPVCEVIWQAGDDLTMTTPSVIAASKQAKLVLQHGADAIVLSKAKSHVILGRDASCEVVVNDKMASRQHARIELRRDKFFVVDQSTNGTFIEVQGEPEIVLRREEVMLRSRGRITLGHSAAVPSDDWVDFVVAD